MNNTINFIYILIIFFLSSCTISRFDSKIYYSKNFYKNLEISSYIEFTNNVPSNRLVIDIIDTTKQQFEINQIKVKFLETLVNFNYKRYSKTSLGYIRNYNFILTDEMVNETKYFTLYFEITLNKNNINISDSIIIYEDYRVIKKDMYKFLDKIFPNIGH